VNVVEDAGAGWIIAGVLVSVLATARLTRLAVYDSWPPAAWLRNRWIAAFNRSAWSELAVCPYCASPYIGLAVVGAGWLSGFHWVWWAVCGWLSVVYLAGMLVAWDTGEE